jgi:hypothetical protein
MTNPFGAAITPIIPITPTPTPVGGIALADLMQQLEEDVPARNNAPTASQYERCVLDASRDFSNRCGRVKISTLEVLAGTGNYDLPMDFLRMIKLDRLNSSNGIINTAQGLIPAPTNWSEKYIIAGRKITFDPTPTYTLTRSIEYKAGWALTEDEGDYTESTYADMTEDESRIVLLKAAALALKMQANAVALDGWRYSIGAESVDKTGQTAAIEARLSAVEKEYLAAVDAYNGSAIGQSDG